MAATASARITATATRTQADELIADVTAATDGSSDPRPAEAVIRWEQAQVRLDEVVAELNAADAALEEYIAEGLGGDGNATSGGSEPRSPAAGPTAFKPMRTDRAKVEEVRPYVGRDYAVATLWDANGNRVLGLHSADDDGPASTATWKPPWSEYPRLRRHVEAHAAARMERDGHRELAMYINMKPCSYPDGCKTNLRALIPRGSTLFVHQVFSDSSSKVHPFPGTGTALRSGDDG